MKYSKLTGIILKKQNYREADQIATVYTRELGKVRCVARGLRLSKSRLIGSFQDLNLVEIELAGNRMPVLTSSKTLQSFSKLKTDLGKTAIGFYGIELIIKLTADEQTNIPAFDLLHGFLSHLNESQTSEWGLYGILDNFSLRLLDSLGFSIEHAQDSMRLPPDLAMHMDKLRQGDFEQSHRLAAENKSTMQLHGIVSRFVEYILERNIKSESFLTSI